VIDIKGPVGSALAADAPLVAALGAASRVFQGYPDAPAGVPCVGYLILNQPDGPFADDQAIADEVLLEVHVFTAGDVDTLPIAAHVDRVLHGMRFAREFSEDVPEPDDKYQHRVSRYRGLFTADDFD
jgi:hypothetical protein